MSYTIEVVKGDITDVDTEAIVNAANNHLWMGAGVAGAIKRAGGDVIEEEATSQGPIIPGEAVFTGAGKLPYKMVIHAAVMGQDLRTSDKLIRRATVAALDIAERHRIASIAFPAFGTGVGGFPMKACAHIMVTAVRAYEPRAEHIRRVVFCVFEEVGNKIFADKLSEKTKG
jgi:O-acetyl-ADP-ribose deacetylase (regulator of RNase III)